MRNSTTLANRQWQMQVEFLLSSVKDDVIDNIMLDISMGTDFGNKDHGVNVRRRLTNRFRSRPPRM